MAGFNALIRNLLTRNTFTLEQGRIARQPGARQSKKLMSSIKEIYSGPASAARLCKLCHATDIGKLLAFRLSSPSTGDFVRPAHRLIGGIGHAGQRKIEEFA